jgi:hypothetical protein
MFRLANFARGIDADHRNLIIQLLDTSTRVRYAEHFKVAPHRLRTAPDGPGRSRLLKDDEQI